MSPWYAVGSYPTRFIFSRDIISQGSFVSVALSLEFPLVAVSDCHTLCCPDFPLRMNTGRSSNKLPTKYCIKYLIFTPKSPLGLPSAHDIPYRKGKVGTRNLSPQRQTIRVPYLYDILGKSLTPRLTMGTYLL